jgi:hypothetical protein
MKKLVFTLVAVYCAVNVVAQKFVAESHLPNVPADGFYRVLLEPHITAYLNPGFTNIRIYDKENKETAYFLKFEVPYLYTITFKEYQILSKRILKDSVTVLTIANPEQKTIDNISLLIKNARVTKSASLYGSDDNQSWYILKDRLYLTDIENTSSTSEVKIVDFPLSNYKFYQIRISDDSEGPLNILKAGYYSNGSEDGTYQEVPVRNFSQTELDREKVSHVRIKFDTAHFVDRLQWEVTGQRLYKRKVIVYSVEQRITTRGKKSQYVDYIGNFEMQTGQPSIFQIPGKKIKEILMVVENHDNQPMKFETVKAFMLSRYATVWLERNNQYTIRIGEDEMPEPVYDLKYFEDSVPKNTQVVKAKSIVALGEPVAAEETTSFFTSKWFIWSALIVVMIFLAVMSYRMVKETSVPEKS